MPCVSRKQRLKRLLFFVILIVMLIQSGCWDRRELDELAIVLGVGVDQKSNGYLLTLEIARPAQFKGAGGNASGGSGAGEEPVFILESSGETVFDAVRHAMAQSSRKLFFPHNQVLIFGETAVKQGLAPALDFFLRDPGPRPTQWVLVAKGTASEILVPKSELEQAPAQALAAIVENGRMNARINPVDLQQFSTLIASPITSATVPMVSVIGKGKDKRLVVEGTAIFKGDRMVGELDGKEARGLHWVKGKVRNAAIILQMPDLHGKFSVEMINNKGRVHPSISNGQPRIELRVYAEGNVADQTSASYLEKPENIKKLVRSTEFAIKREIESAIYKSKQLRTDIFGFGLVLSQEYPRAWQSLKADWEERYPDLAVSVEVKANIWRIGDLKRAIVRSAK